MTLRLIFCVGVISPASCVNSFGNRMNFFLLNLAEVPGKIIDLFAVEFDYPGFSISSFLCRERYLLLAQFISGSNDGTIRADTKFLLVANRRRLLKEYRSSFKRVLIC